MKTLAFQYTRQPWLSQGEIFSKHQQPALRWIASRQLLCGNRKENSFSVGSKVFRVKNYSGLLSGTVIAAGQLTQAVRALVCSQVVVRYKYQIESNRNESSIGLLITTFPFDLTYS